MNNSDLSLDFLKKCQKCRENGVPNDMAILAALQDLADWKDQHPRKGLWDAKKVCDFIEENIDNYLYINRDWNAPQIKSNFIEDLQSNGGINHVKRSTKNQTRD